MTAEQELADRDAKNRARLKAIEDALKARGVVDIKFAWSKHRHLPGQYVIDSVCEVLESFLAGKMRPMEPFWDSCWTSKTESLKKLVAAAKVRFDHIAGRVPCSLDAKQHAEWWLDDYARLMSGAVETKAECSLCAAGINSFIDPDTGKKWHARNGTVVLCSAQKTVAKPGLKAPPMEPPCLCGRGRDFHPWRFCETYIPVPRNEKP